MGSPPSTCVSDHVRLRRINKSSSLVLAPSTTRRYTFQINIDVPVGFFFSFSCTKGSDVRLSVPIIIELYVL